jgi:hypothetical protein
MTRILTTALQIAMIAAVIWATWRLLADQHKTDSKNHRDLDQTRHHARRCEALNRAPETEQTNDQT